MGSVDDSKKQQSCFSFGFLCVPHRQETNPLCHADITCLPPVPSGLLHLVNWFDGLFQQSQIQCALFDSSSDPFQAHPTFSGPQVRRVFVKYAVFWSPATSACADPGATSCMRSLALRKHPSQSEAAQDTGWVHVCAGHTQSPVLELISSIFLMTPDTISVLQAYFLFFNLIDSAKSIYQQREAA